MKEEKKWKKVLSDIVLMIDVLDDEDECDGGL